MKIQAVVLTLMLLGALFIASHCWAADYYVYCSDGKIAVDSRDMGKYKMETRAKNVKMVNKFSNQKDAETRAKHAGGVGAKCK